MYSIKMMCGHCGLWISILTLFIYLNLLRLAVPARKACHALSLETIKKVLTVWASMRGQYNPSLQNRIST